jgi:hypothetical protein
VVTGCAATGNDGTLLRHREAPTCFPHRSTAREILASCFALRNMRSGLVPERWDAFDGLMDGRSNMEGRKGFGEANRVEIGIHIASATRRNELSEGLSEDSYTT